MSFSCRKFNRIKLPPMVPYIAGLSQPFIYLEENVRAIRIYGTNFTQSSIVTVNGNVCYSQFNGSDELLLYIPLFFDSGYYEIQVKNPGTTIPLKSNISYVGNNAWLLSNQVPLIIE